MAAGGIILKKTALINSSKQPVASPLYVAGASFGFDQMVQYCLWKLISETGFIHNDELTEMESMVLSKILKTKIARDRGSLAGNSEYPLSVLNSAIDKIVLRIKTMQTENQKYHSILTENRRLKNGGNKQEKVSEQANTTFPSFKMNRSINEIGLSRRAARILQSIGIDTLEKLRACSLSRLQNQQRIGVKTLHDIEAILSKYPGQASPDR